MTTVTVFNDKTGLHKGFEASGHAGYADSGSDIVCAAVSMLTINTINSIETLTDDFISYESDEEENYIKLILDEDSSHDAQLLIDSMVLGLSELSKNYKEYFRLIIEEV